MIQRFLSRLWSFLQCHGRVSLLLFGILLCLAVFRFYNFSTRQVTPPYMLSALPKEFLSPFQTKAPSSAYCTRRIHEAVDRNDNKDSRGPPFDSTNKDYHVYKALSQLNCRQISALFLHSQPSNEEMNFPLAYVLQLYKGAGLFVKQLQFIYMPQNVYCIHIDASSSLEFVSAVEQIVKCLPNVFVTKKRIKVIYLHVSTVRAQLNCIEDLLESPVPWRYLFNLCGQDFPLYSNQGIVQALKALNGRTNSESCELKGTEKLRTSTVFEVRQVSRGTTTHEAYRWVNPGEKKAPPPYGVKVYKGSSFIAGTREFCHYAVNDKTAKAFLDWLNDTMYVDESFFPSLYRRNGVPGGVPGKQPEFITRAVNWQGPRNIPCYGYWLRGICVLSLADLSWVLGTQFQNSLFTQKIDFDYDTELVDCLFVKVQERTHHPYNNNSISWNGPCAEE